MRKVLIITFLSISFFACSQTINNEKNAKSISQKKIALKFTKNFINEEYDSCWVYFDKSINPEITISLFKQTLGQAKLILPRKEDNIKLYMTGIKFINEEPFPYYSFKYVDDVSKPAGFSFDVLFINDSSQLVAGFTPNRRITKKNHASSSKGSETIISTREEIKIEGEIYSIKGINLIHFEKKTSLIAIQIERIIPDIKQPDLEKWAYSEGIVFAKWLYRSEQYKLAVKKAKEMDVTLMDKIGVSFINPNTGRGYNVMIKTSDYQ